jgi:hypothetical protein
MVRVAKENHGLVQGSKPIQEILCSSLLCLLGHRREITHAVTQMTSWITSAGDGDISVGKTDLLNNVQDPGVLVETAADQARDEM